jgi:uncharacterized protein (TIGR03067 family)
MLTASLLLAAALAPADAPTPPPDAAVSDAGELQGEWEVVSAFTQGRDSTAGFKGDHFRFAGTTVVYIPLPGGPRKPSGVHVNLTADPPAVDREGVNGPGTRQLGIYRRTADELVWAFDVSGDGRPTSLEPTRSVLLWTLRRVKK